MWLHSGGRATGRPVVTWGAAEDRGGRDSWTSSAGHWDCVGFGRRTCHAGRSHGDCDPASAATVIFGCTIVSNPTSTHFTNCPNSNLAGASLGGLNLSYTNFAGCSS